MLKTSIQRRRRQLPAAIRFRTSVYLLPLLRHSTDKMIFNIHYTSMRRPPLRYGFLSFAPEEDIHSHRATRNTLLLGTVSSNLFI